MTIQTSTLIGILFIAVPLLLTIKTWSKGVLPFAWGMCRFIFWLALFPVFTIRCMADRYKVIIALLVITSIIVGVLILTTGIERTDLSLSRVIHQKIDTGPSLDFFADRYFWVIIISAGVIAVCSFSEYNIDYYPEWVPKIIRLEN